MINEIQDRRFLLLKYGVGFCVLYFLIIVFLDFSLWEAVGLLFFTFVLNKLISKLGKTVPVIELSVFLLTLQLYFAPLITYHIFENKTIYFMYVEKEIYFPFVVPILICIYTGLTLPVFSKVKIVFSKASFYSEDNSRIGRLLLFVSFIAKFSSSFQLGGLGFVFYLLENLMIVGMIYLLFSKDKVDKYLVIAAFILYTIDIVSGGMFYDLFAISGFFFCYLAFLFHFSKFQKYIFLVLGLGAIFFVQSLKHDYREIIWSTDSGSEAVDNVDVFLELAGDRIDDNSLLFDLSTLDRFISRVNQGWILSKVLEHVPFNEEFTNGETLIEDLEAVFLPRFLVPNKKSVGGEENQAKFAKFTGRYLVGSTTMRIGAVADAYVNFGSIGAGILLFCFGLLLNFIFKYFLKQSAVDPTYLFWLPFIFSHVIRMSDFLVLLNYIFKGFIFMLIILHLLDRIKSNRIELRKNLEYLSTK